MKMKNLKVAAASTVVMCSAMFVAPTHAVAVEECPMEPGQHSCNPEVSVPEPGMLALIGLGIAGIGISRIKRK